MIEAFTIVFVFTVCAGLFIMAKMPAGIRTEETAREEMQNLRQYRATLLEKVRRGQQEGWDEVMMRPVYEQLRSTEDRIRRPSIR
jgi:hypothetical protein